LFKIVVKNLNVERLLDLLHILEFNSKLGHLIHNLALNFLHIEILAHRFIKTQILAFVHIHHFTHAFDGDDGSKLNAI
jgi:hypothetical protein